LRGVAAGLGADALSSAAAVLETALLQGDRPHALVLLPALETRLDAALAAAAALQAAPDAPEPGMPEPPVAGDHADLTALVAEIQDLLASNSLRVTERLPALRCAAAGLDGLARLDELACAVERLDYRAAQTILAAFADALGLSTLA
jgi:HPt (histidine-containing phosphotransfer) domain-containing protein